MAWNPFHRVTGRAKGSKSKSETAFERLREAQTMLEKKANFIEAKIELEGAEAVRWAGESSTGGRGKALCALRRRKLFEKQLERIRKQQTMLDTQLVTLDVTQSNLLVLDSLQASNEAMRKSSTSIDQIDEVMDEAREQQRLSEELSEAITGVDEDDEALLEELDNLVKDSEYVRRRRKRDDPMTTSGTSEKQSTARGSATKARPASASSSAQLLAALPEPPQCELGKRRRRGKERAKTEDELKRLSSWAN